MPHRGSLRGLCSTCRYGPDCAFRIHAGGAVWHCCEFDDAEEDKPLAEPATTSRPVPDVSSAISGAQVRGLCSTCAEREHCRLAGSRGAVWQCEEFR